MLVMSTKAHRYNLGMKTYAILDHDIFSVHLSIRYNFYCDTRHMKIESIYEISE